MRQFGLPAGRSFSRSLFPGEDVFSEDEVFSAEDDEDLEVLKAAVALRVTILEEDSSL